MAQTITPRGFAESLVTALAAAVEAVTGGVTVDASAEPAGGPGWCVDATVTGDLRGSLAVWVDRAGGEAIAQRVMGNDEIPEASAVCDVLGEMSGQAAAALSLTATYVGVTIAILGVEAGDAPPDAVVFDVGAGGAALARIAVGGSALAVAPPAPGPTADAAAPDKLEVVLDIELPLVVRFARTVMTLKALSSLGPGSIVDMERSPDEPVQLLVGDRVIARGEVVVVGGNYGVRVTDLVSPGERARAVEA